MGDVVYQVDAFTDSPFRGNPAGVCVLAEARSPEWMQNVAAEMNLAETAFLVKAAVGFDLRWFTPKTEVDLCGHATLASAHVLFETGVLPRDSAAQFFTRSGLLTAKVLPGGWIEMNFPAVPVREGGPAAELAEALGVTPVFVGDNGMDLLAEVADEATVRIMRPDFNKLLRLKTRGVIVTSRGTGGYDCVSRFFAPAVGIAEDPVTGSAHCALGPYWSAKLGKQELSAYQASERGGSLRVVDAGERVFLSGRAVTVMRCELMA